MFWSERILILKYILALMYDIPSYSINSFTKYKLHLNKVSIQFTQYQLLQTMNINQKSLHETIKSQSNYHISKNKEIGQSDFRLHFIISNLKINGNVEEVLKNIRVRISKIGLVQTIQIIERRLNFIDVGVGLKYDHDAIRYLHYQTNKIHLLDSRGRQFELRPLVCKAFFGHLEEINKPAKYSVVSQQSLMFQRRAAEEKYRALIKAQQKQEQGKRNRSRSQTSTKNKRNSSKSRSRARQRVQDRSMDTRNRSRSRYTQRSSIHHKKDSRFVESQQQERRPQFRVIIAGIPSGLQYPIIDQQLYRQGFAIQKMIWIKKENIDLLQVKLSDRKQYNKIQNTSLRFKDQHVLCLVIDQNQPDDLIDILKDYQVRVQFRSSIQKNSAIQQIFRYGNLVDCLQGKSNNRSFFVTFTKKQSVQSILNQNNSNFEAFLDSEVFPIRRRLEPLMTYRRQSNRQRTRSVSRYRTEQQPYVSRRY